MKIVLLITGFMFFAFNVNAQNNVDSTTAQRVPGGVEVTFYISKKCFAENETKKDFGVTISYYVKKKDWELVNYSNDKLKASTDRLFIKCLVWEDTEIRDVRLFLWSSKLGKSNNLTNLEASAVPVVAKI